MDAIPAVRFNYVFKLFDQKVSLLSEELVFDTVEIGNDGIAAIREALDAMPNCSYVKLDSCGIDDDVMAQLRADYPDKQIVWRVFVGKYSILTDEEMLRMTFSIGDDDTSGLQYCNDVKYLDVNSSKITNISFMSHMPKLECVILTLTKVKDLSPLANCPNLTWLELANCSGVNDLSGISSLTGLKYLNISGTKVTDLNVLENVPLKRLKCAKSRLKESDLDSFALDHPDCSVVNTGSVLGYGWRFDDYNQKIPFAYYTELQKIFRYDDKTFSGNRK